MKVSGASDDLLVDISDALSERDKVRFTVHTRTKLPQFAKPVLSVVRQHEEFVWLHDCLEDNDQYAGYIIPPPPPRPDFDASREKLQRLGDGEANMAKDEFLKMKQELEAEYLAIFKKTVAMHEIFLQRLAAHEKFREDNNFKIFLEYENELAVRGKSKTEKIAGSISNISKSFTDFVITTSQVAGSAAAANSLNKHLGRTPKQILPSTTNNRNNTITSNNNKVISSTTSNNSATDAEVTSSSTASNQNNSATSDKNSKDQYTKSVDSSSGSEGTHNGNNNSNDEIDEQYFEKERLFLALYLNSIKETASQSEHMSESRKRLAADYLQLSQQFIKLASVEVMPITAQTKDSSNLISCPIPSLIVPEARPKPETSSAQSNRNQLDLRNDERELSDSVEDEEDLLAEKQVACTSSNQNRDIKPATNTQGRNLESARGIPSGTSANDNTSNGLKQLLLHLSDYLEQARKIENRIASDEDLKLTDTFQYYKRDTIAAQELLMRRLRVMAEYENATKNLEKARQKGRTQMQYADVIQKQAKENFVSMSKLAKQELIDHKQRRIASFKKAFSDMVELELKHLRSHTQLISNCLDVCKGITKE